MNIKAITQDLGPSFALFLVSLPMSMGVANACGAPSFMGILAAIVGAILVGIIGDAHLQVAGPSAALTVLVLDMLNKHGSSMFMLIVMLAGVLQVVGAWFKIGRYFKAVSPAVIRAMLSGIGVLIIGSQIHVMLGAEVYASGLKNIINIPTSILQVFSSQSPFINQAAAMGMLTFIIIVFWEKLKPKALKILPGALLGVMITSFLALLLKLDISYVSIPENISNLIQLPKLSVWQSGFSTSILFAAIALAFIATTETLLCANAVARMHNGPRTNYNKELMAQGMANVLCGFLGALPVSGVISRTTANVDAGAKSKYSTILHGFWILIFLTMFPFILRMIPKASLAGILVYVGIKLLNISAIKSLFKYGKAVIAIFIATIVGIVTIDLLNGVIIGLVLSTIKLVYSLSHIQIERSEKDDSIEIMLHGSATFLALPDLGHELETIPAGSKVCFHVEHLDFIDHACLDLLSAFKHRHEDNGGKVELEWDTLFDRYTQGKSITSPEFKLPNIDTDAPIQDET